MWVIYGAFILTTLTIFIVVHRRRVSEVAPTTYDPPVKIERNDFPQATAETLVVLFSSNVCDSCSNVRDKALVVSSDQVNVIDVEYEDTVGKKLHGKYQIEAVPTLVIADENGVVLSSYVGPVTATDLWAGVARARGDEVQGCSNH